MHLASLGAGSLELLFVNRNEHEKELQGFGGCRECLEALLPSVQQVFPPDVS